MKTCWCKPKTNNMRESRLDGPRAGFGMMISTERDQAITCDMWDSTRCCMFGLTFRTEVFSDGVRRMQVGQLP